MNRPESHDGAGFPDGTRIGTLALPSDAPLELLDLLQTAAGPASPDELIDEPAAVAAFVAARADIGPGPTVPWAVPPAPWVPTQKTRVPAGRLRTQPSRHSIRTFAAAAVSFLVLGGGLAAADVLPTPAQRWVSTTLDKIGISVPSPGSSGPQSNGAGAFGDAATEGEGNGPVVNPLTTVSVNRLSAPSAPQPAAPAAPAGPAGSAAGASPTASPPAARSAASPKSLPPRSPSAQQHPSQQRPSQGNPSPQNSPSGPAQPAAGQPSSGQPSAGQPPSGRSNGSASGRAEGSGNGKSATSSGRRAGNGKAPAQKSNQGAGSRSAAGLDLDAIGQSGRVGVPGLVRGPR